MRARSFTASALGWSRQAVRTAIRKWEVTRYMATNESHAEDDMTNRQTTYVAAALANSTSGVECLNCTDF
jgi:hypothetical protein